MSNSHSTSSQNNIGQCKLNHNHSLPYYPTQQQMTMNYYPPPNFMPPPQYPPQHYQNPQQPQGMFGNFIMNQLSQHMYGSNKNLPQQPW